MGQGSSQYPNEATVAAKESVNLILEGEGMETDTVAEEAVFRAPSGKRKMKRAIASDRKGKARSEKHREHTGSGSATLDDSDSDQPDAKSQRSRKSAYTFDKVRSFLHKTKNMKGVVVEEYFPDRKLFIDSVQAFMRGDGEDKFTAQEIYRLKKIVLKLKLELQNDIDGFETS